MALSAVLIWQTPKGDHFVRFSDILGIKSCKEMIPEHKNDTVLGTSNRVDNLVKTGSILHQIAFIYYTMVISRDMLDSDSSFAALSLSSLCCFRWFNSSTLKKSRPSSFCSGLWSSQTKDILMGMSNSVWSWFLAAETLWMCFRWRKPDGKLASWFWERFTCRNLKHRTKRGDSFLQTNKASLKTSTLKTNPKLPLQLYLRRIYICICILSHSHIPAQIKYVILNKKERRKATPAASLLDP